MGSCCVLLKGAELRLNKYSDSPVPGLATDSCFDGSSPKRLQDPPEGSPQVRAAESEGMPEPFGQGKNTVSKFIVKQFLFF